MSENKINIGLIGVGHLGKIHIKCIRQSPLCRLVGVWDTDKSAEHLVAKDEGLPVFNTIDDLLSIADAVFIVSPTSTHFDWAQFCLSKGKHVFIEKPVTAILSEAQALTKYTENKNLKIQVGHVERFNPAYQSVKNLFHKPMFIEGHRLAEFKPRGTDVSVVMDLMIHDIDLVLSIVGRPVSDIRASGVAVISATPDICNARLEFEGGAIANLTASRISLKQMRKIRVFQADQYIAMDLLKKESQIVSISDEAPFDHPFSWPVGTGAGTKHISLDMKSVEASNAILDEINAFAASILEDAPIQVGLIDGLNALQVAEDILHIINK